MQKKLIALAVAGVASSAAFAQSNVTIYGVLKPSYDAVSLKDNTGAKTKAYGINSNASLIGFQGEENLGNGLKAIFKLESYFDIASGDNGDSYGKGGFSGARDTWVGLQGDSWGSVTLGARDSAYKLVSASYDFFADSLGDYNNIFTNGAGSRDAQSIFYTSPVWSGFQLTASYAFDQLGNDGKTYTTAANAGNTGTLGYVQNPNGTDTDNRKIALAGSYTWGGLNVFAAYQEAQHPQQLTGSASDDKLYRMGVKYVFNNKASIAGIYENVTKYNVTTFAKSDDHDTWGLLGSFPVTGNINLLGNYIKASNNDTITTGDSGGRVYAFGGEYLFSKRTKISAIYADYKNDVKGTFAKFDSGYSSGAGGKGDGFSVRLQHSF